MFEHSGGGRQLCLPNSAPKKQLRHPKDAVVAQGSVLSALARCPLRHSSRMMLPNTAEHSRPIRVQHHCHHRYTVSLAVLLPSPGVGLLTVSAQFVGRYESIFTGYPWCSEPDSNRHTRKREILSLLCLPIPPSEQYFYIKFGGTSRSRTEHQWIMSPLL